MLKAGNKDAQDKVEKLSIEFKLNVHVVLMDFCQVETNFLHSDLDLIFQIGLLCNNTIDFVAIFNDLIQTIRCGNTDSKKQSLVFCLC